MTLSTTFQLLFLISLNTFLFLLDPRWLRSAPKRDTRGLTYCNRLYDVCACDINALFDLYSCKLLTTSSWPFSQTHPPHWNTCVGGGKKEASSLKKKKKKVIMASQSWESCLFWIWVNKPRLEKQSSGKHFNRWLQDESEAQLSQKATSSCRNTHIQQKIKQQLIILTEKNRAAVSQNDLRIVLKLWREKMASIELRWSLLATEKKSFSTESLRL